MGLIDDLLDLQIPRNVKISPDGQRIIYVASTTNRPKHVNRTVSAIWLAQAGQERSARQITSGRYNDAEPQWSADGDVIAFISDRERPAETSAIYILPMQVGGEAYALTAPDNERAIETFRWSPNGKFIAYVSADEKTAERKQREKDRDDANVWGEDLVYSRLRLVDVASRQVTTLVAGVEHVTGLAWSPDGSRIAFLHTKKPGIEARFLYGCSISVIEVSTGNVRPVQHFASTIGDPKWVGDSLFFTGNVIPSVLTSAQALWSLDLESDSPEFRRRAHGDVDCAGEVVQTGSDVVVGSKRGVGEYIHILDGETLQTYESNIPSFDAKLTADKDLILAVVRSSVGVPFEVYSTATSTGTHVQLSSHGDALKKYDFGTATVLECQSDDKEVDLDAIYFSPAKPKGKNGPKGPFPTAVLCHGGPYARSTNAFDQQPATWMMPALLEAGYGVLMPNYRGGSGRGEAFAASSRGRIGTVEYDDVITLTQHAIVTGYADKDRLLIGGWSNGGGISNLASVRNGMHGLGWRFQAAIPGAGASDSDTMVFTSDMGLTFGLDHRDPQSPWANDLNATSTRANASAIWTFKKAVDAGGVVPPMLILHCEQDKRVPIEQAVALRRALQYHGLPFEFVSYPREGHRMVERMHVKDRVERVLRWANTYISPL